MNFIIWLVVGGLIGWVASMIMRTDGQQGIVLNVVVGIVGAMLGGWFISPMVGAGTINDGMFSIGALLVSLLGAVILLAIVNLFRRGSAALRPCGAGVRSAHPVRLGPPPRPAAQPPGCAPVCRRPPACAAPRSRSARSVRRCSR